MVSSSMPSANAVARAWNAAGREWVDEWGFSCFACGRWEPEWEGCKASFRGLERARLLGKQFGGTNEADNFALLCKRCHQDSPDTPDTNDIMGWIDGREAWIVRDAREVNTLLPDELILRWQDARCPNYAKAIDLDLIYVGEEDGQHVFEAVGVPPLPTDRFCVDTLPPKTTVRYCLDPKLIPVPKELPDA